jgi:choline transport protein
MTSEEKKAPTDVEGSEDEAVVVIEDGVALNASGWRDQLNRQYNLLSLTSVALTVDNAWAALGSSISVSIRLYYLFSLLRVSMTRI